MRAFLLLFLGAAMLGAQNNAITLQGGTTLTQRREITLPPNPFFGVLREDNGYAVALTYERRLLGGNVAALWLQVPITVVQATNTDILPALARPFFGDTTGVSGYVTPGALVKLLPGRRVEPFVFVGAGYARVVEAELTSLSPVRGGSANRGTWAVTYGGGADLRIVRWFAVRGELRNLYTGETQGAIQLPEETRQRNTLVLAGGLSFRF